MQIMADTRLKTLRTDLRPKVSQETIAHMSHITLNTYRNAESGGNVSFTTARAILAAINQLRRDPKRNLPVLTMDDLDLWDRIV